MKQVKPFIFPVTAWLLKRNLWVNVTFFPLASLTESYSFWIGLKVLIPLDTLDDKDKLTLTIKTDDITWGRRDMDQQRQ